MSSRPSPAGRLLPIAVALACAAAAGVFLPACSDDSPEHPAEPAPPAGSLVTASDCKSGKLAIDGEDPSSVDCVEWTYAGDGTLAVTHVNAGLNCCPGTIAAEIEIIGSAIAITEREGDDAEPCDCLCLFDLDYEFSGLSAGPCTLTFHEAYLPSGAAVLTVTIDLATEPEGSFCVSRDTYPWSI